MLQGLFLAALGLGQLTAALDSRIELDYATFQGRDAALTGTTNFLGMPFAVAGRLENPRLIGPQDALEGVQEATDYGPACPQQNLVASPLYQQNRVIGSTLGFLQSFIQPVLRQDEDCLSINVQIPQGINDTANLPVLMWIHGGGFELGSSGSLGSETTALQGVIYQVSSSHPSFCVFD
jgi:carboxylesterase type B